MSVGPFFGELVYVPDPNRFVSYERCRASHPSVRRQLHRLQRQPRLVLAAESHAICQGGRGGGYCCEQGDGGGTVVLCQEKPWVNCETLAYELSHAVAVQEGLVQCRGQGNDYPGVDHPCGYFDEVDLACSEARACREAGRCGQGLRRAKEQSCVDYHARWAMKSVYPDICAADVNYAVRRGIRVCTPNEARRRTRFMRALGLLAFWSLL